MATESREVKLTLKAFAAYSNLYASPRSENNVRFKMAISEAKKGNIKELLKFVLGYVFSRQGASPYYVWKSMNLLDENDNWQNEEINYKE